MIRKTIRVTDLYALEKHSGSDVIAYTNVPRKGERHYATSVGSYSTSSVWLAHLVGYLYGLSYVAIANGEADPLSPHLVSVTKEAQRRDAAYFEEGRNLALKHRETDHG